MLHTDIPTPLEVERLAEFRDPACVSIYLSTTPLPQGEDKTRIELSNAVNDALAELETSGVEKSVREDLRSLADELVDDDEFWPYLSNSLVVFITPSSIRTFRLPNRLTSVTEVSDRFFIKPLLRAVTFSQSAFVLALSENAVRLVEVTPDSPAFDVSVADLPSDAASAVGKASISGRSPSGRIQGSEGKKVRLQQYSRAVDSALRPILSGHDLPLILAATQPLAGIYRSVNSYPRLATATIEGNPDTVSDAELAEAARGVLDGIYADELARVRDLFEQRSGEGRSTTDLSDVARAATFGAIDTLLVSIDGTVSGTIDEQTGALTLSDDASAESYGVIDEITRRALRTGATVIGVRDEEIPGGGPVAAILRYSV
ncbi:MAG: hypothetical protein Q8M65_08660 [Rhodoglobus sp.]|nr:hypothetical protein [Rhodoglobus sp.]